MEIASKRRPHPLGMGATKPSVHQLKTRCKGIGRICSLLVMLLTVAAVARATDFNSEAQALQTRGDWAGLRNLATEWSQSEPRSAAPWVYLGVADDQLGQTTSAIAAYERGLAIDPRLSTGWMYLAADYHKTGQHQKVAEVIRKLKTSNPSMAAMLENQYASDLPHEAGGVPSGLPQKAAALLAHVRQWRSDAELMIIDVNDWSNNGHYTVQYDFFSPSTGAGYVVMGDSERPVAAANWGSVPIPAGFLDLPSAVQQARAQGMANNPWDHAHLQVGNHGLVWTIKMTYQVATANDPYSRMNAFEIPAGGGSMLGSAPIGGAFGNAIGGGAVQQYDTTTGMPCPTGGCVTGGFVGKYARSGGVGPFAVPPPLHDPTTGALIPGTGAITEAPPNGAGAVQPYYNGSGATGQNSPSAVVGGILNSFGLGSSAPAQNSYGGAAQGGYNSPAAGYYGGGSSGGYQAPPPAVDSAPSQQEQIQRQRREIQQLQGEE